MKDTLQKRVVSDSLSKTLPRKLKNMKYKRAFFFSLKQGTLSFSNQMINLYKLQSEF